MRFPLPSLFRAAAIGLLIGASSLPAQADRLRDEVEADSFGNLVIWSRSGYKRIVVGQGHLAGEYERYLDANGSRVVYGTDDLDDDRGREGWHHRDCYYPPVLLKGRSYMYGLAEGELPQLSSSCHPLAD